MTKRTLGLAGLVILGLAGIAWAQGAGGAFVPSFNYVITGQWTWTQGSPFIFEGATANANETTFTITDPTADRTITFPNASGIVALSSVAATSQVTAGTIALDGTNPSSLTTGLSAIAGCTVTRNNSVAPGLDPLVFSVITTTAIGRVDVYAWKATAADDTTMIASTNNSETVMVVCVGTP